MLISEVDSVNTLFFISQQQDQGDAAEEIERGSCE